MMVQEESSDQKWKAQVFNPRASQLFCLARLSAVVTGTVPEGPRELQRPETVPPRGARVGQRTRTCLVRPRLLVWRRSRRQTVQRGRVQGQGEGDL